MAIDLNNLKISDTRQTLIDNHLNTPVKKGDDVYVRGFGSQNREAMGGMTKVIDIVEGGITIKEYSRDRIVKDGDYVKSTINIGHNPFINIDYSELPRVVNFALESIINIVGGENRGYKTKNGEIIKRCNFNPFVEIDGKKYYYQRGLVWSLEDKQNLMESLFNHINCGLVILRRRPFSWNEEQIKSEDTGMYDVVDGKQRLTAIMEFLNCEYPDKYGYYFSDYSEISQNRLLSCQLLSYAEFDEHVNDESILKQFLKVNFSGVPQSKEHIAYVESLYKKF